MKPIPLSTNPNVFWKVGSTWRFSIRRGTELAPVLLNGVVTMRSSFRASAVDGEVIITLDGSSGLSIPDPNNGLTSYVLSAEQTALFPVNEKIFFDLEHTDVLGGVWQSPTFYFKADPQVTV